MTHKKNRKFRILSIVISAILLVGIFPVAVSAASCENCGVNSDYTVEYEYWTATYHTVRHWCDNCGKDQNMGGAAERHSFSHYSSSYDRCDDCGYKIACECDDGECSHDDTYTEWDDCDWYEYCEDCGEEIDSGTEHGETEYKDWVYYSTTRHRRFVYCVPDKVGKYPTVIYRNPYVDDQECLSETEICNRKLNEYKVLLDNGYAVVFQHCRGRGKSSGDCIPYIYEREDGLRLQEWIRWQDFYNGELYLHGKSYGASVHLVTAPFANDIKGAIIEVQDCERYNCNYRNGFYKMGLHGGWYVNMYKRKSRFEKYYSTDAYKMLSLADFSKTVFGETAEDFDEILQHPGRNDAFWCTRYGGGEAHEAIKHANIPILLVTGAYDIYTGGVFDMWKDLDGGTRSMCALAVHPYEHGGWGDKQPITFENGTLVSQFGNYVLGWLDFSRGKCESPFELGKITYYNLFENNWHTDGFYDAESTLRIRLGEGSVKYKYNPYAPASFKGGLSANFGGNAWQDKPNSRYDIISLYTPEFEEDTFIKGKIKAKLKVSSDCEDTCFYMRLSLCKGEGDYGLRDDINQISNFAPEYVPGEEIEMDFSFDEHAFTVKKGEKLRVDISSSAFPHYAPHTNNRGLFSEQTTAKVASNTVIFDASYIELPIKK